jgi:hypothetical protein
MIQLLVAAGVVAVAVVVGLVLRRRQHVDVPTQVSYEAPTQLDRADFPEATAQWLVAVFSSASCTSCADVVRKASVLRTEAVDVVDVEYTAAKALHTKYRIEGVPIVVIADSDGVVHKHFIGPVTATDLWAACAEARTDD